MESFPLLLKGTLSVLLVPTTPWQNPYWRPPGWGWLVARILGAGAEEEEPMWVSLVWLQAPPPEFAGTGLDGKGGCHLDELAAAVEPPPPRAVATGMVPAAPSSPLDGSPSLHPPYSLSVPWGSARGKRSPEPSSNPRWKAKCHSCGPGSEPGNPF